MIWIALYFVVLLLIFKYSKSKLTKAGYAILFLIPIMNYYDEITYKDRVRLGYGCIVKADRNINSSYYVIIQENENEIKYSLDGLEEPFDPSVIGKCVNFKYYKDAFGFEILLTINK